jgi:flagellar hook-basal body protein
MGDVRINAKSTLVTLTRSIEVISGNLTGASIYGYKGVRLSFSDTLVNVIRSGTGASGGSGGLNPIQVGTGGIGVGATTTDFSQGSIQQTKNAGDVAISGNAFFATVDAAGRITYTRNGEFHFDDQGNLVTNDGLYVLGVFDDLRDVTQNTKLIDFDTTIDLTRQDQVQAAMNTKGISVNFSQLNNVQMVNVNGATLGTDADGNITGGLTTGTAVLSLAFGVNASQASSNATLFSFLDITSTDFIEDRILPQTFIAAGALGGLTTVAGAVVTRTGPLTIGSVMGPTGPLTVVVNLTSTNNFLSNTSLDNAKLIAQAINDLAAQTGVGASIVVNSNKLDQAAIVLTHVQRALSQVNTRLNVKVEIDPITGLNTLEQSLATSRVGVLENARDNRGNLFHRISLKSLIGRSPRFVPQAGDRFQFDGTGQLINTSRGPDADSAPPFQTGIHIALSKFSNNDGLQKLRGSSQFSYSEAAGEIVVGYAGQDQGKIIDNKRGTESVGSSVIGTENQIIPQALEASNTSIAEALPDLTIAQKSFTSNTKVVNVGNSIIDDLNGLIR